MHHERSYVTGAILLASLTAAGSAWSDEPLPGTPPVLYWPQSSYGGPVVSGSNFQPEHGTSPLGGLVNDDPYYQAKGIPIEGLRLYPSALTGISFDDNVYRSASSDRDDFFFTEAAGLQLVASENRWLLDIYGDGALNRYDRYSDENTNDYSLGALGQYRLTSAANLSGQVSYSGLHESREEVDTNPDQSEPTRYQEFRSSVNASYKPSWLGFTVGGSVDRYVFLDSPVFGGGPALDNKGRDQTIYSGFGQFSADFSPGYSAFVRGSFNSDHPINQLGAPRSTQGDEFDAGLRFLLSHTVEGEAYVGYLHQEYISPLPDVSGLDFGADLTWYPTRLLTVKLSAGRQIQSTTLPLSSAGDSRYVLLSADYELTRLIHLTARVNYDDINYVGSKPDRDDGTPRFGLGGRWIISHYASLDIDYNYTKRWSTVSAAPAATFKDNLVTAALNLQI